MWRKQRSEILNWFYFSIYLVSNVHLGCLQMPSWWGVHFFFLFLLHSVFFACSAKEWKKKDILRQKIDFRGLQQIWLFPVVPAVKRRRCRAVLYSTFSAHDWSWTTCDGNYGVACPLRGCSLKLIRNYSGATLKKQKKQVGDIFKSKIDASVYFSGENLWWLVKLLLIRVTLDHTAP